MEIVTLSKKGRPALQRRRVRAMERRPLRRLPGGGRRRRPRRRRCGRGDRARTSVLDGFAAAPGLDGAGLRRLLEQANRDVVARQAEGGPLADMRSTVVMAALDLDDRELTWAHSGDSRAYLFRGGTLVARTVDHSLVQQMVAGGMIDEEGARLHPQRNLLLSALGAAEGVPDISVSERMSVAPAMHCCCAATASGRCSAMHSCRRRCWPRTTRANGSSRSTPKSRRAPSQATTTTRPLRLAHVACAGTVNPVP